LAEDDVAVRELTHTILNDLGYRVFAAEDGNAAYEMLESGRVPHPHLLITDVVMPRMGGRELAEKVRTLLPATRVIFASGYNEEEVLRAGIETDTIAFLSKPYSLNGLVAKVRAVLDAPDGPGRS